MVQHLYYCSFDIFACRRRFSVVHPGEADKIPIIESSDPLFHLFALSGGSPDRVNIAGTIRPPAPGCC